MTALAPQPGILDIALYQGGASHLDGVHDVLKLSSNENPAGPPASAIAALTAAAQGVHRYPSTDHADLRAAIAGVWGLDADRICCGVGSGEVLNLLAQCYAGPGDEVMFTEHGFAMYPIYARAAGATPIKVAERGRCVDVDALLRAATPRTRLVYIANPGNPTGTMIPMTEITRLADGLPEDCLLVLDGAYAEFAEGYDGGQSLAQSRANVFMTRTFSKLFGLGGMRVGWGYGARAVIDVLSRVRGPFNLSAPAIAAAKAAVCDTAFRRKAAEENAAQRERLVEAMRQMGLAIDDSHANFVLPRFENAQSADACEAHLRGQGILVRKTAGYGLPQALRMTVGTRADCDRLLAALRQFMGEAVQ